MFFKSVTKGANDWWRFVLGILVIFISYSIGQIPLFLALRRSVDQSDDLSLADIAEFQNKADFSLFGINSNMGFILLLTIFVFAFLGFFAAFKLIHKRPFRSLINNRLEISWKKIFTSFFLWLSIGIALELFFYFQNPDLYSFHFKWELFVPLVIISVILLPIQTSLEELVFRGYLMQGFGLIFKNKWLPLIITSIAFSLIHSMNPEIEAFGFWKMQMYYISAGLLLGIITIMDDGLELALGVHAATNFIGAVFVGYDGAAIKTDSLFTVREINPISITIAFLIGAIIFVLIVRKMYNWKSFKYLLEEIEYDTNTEVV